MQACKQDRRKKTHLFRRSRVVNCNAFCDDIVNELVSRPNIAHSMRLVLQHVDLEASSGVCPEHDIFDYAAFREVQNELFGFEVKHVRRAIWVAQLQQLSSGLHSLYSACSGRIQ